MITPTRRVRRCGAAILCSAGLITGPGPLCAQAPMALTLGGAARLAADKSAGPETARLRQDQAEARVRQRRADYLPSISGMVSEGERTFNSASFGITFRDPLTGRPAFDPNGELLGPVRTWDLRGTLRQSIADFSAIARVRAARASATAAGADASNASQQAAAAAAVTYIRAVRADAQVGARLADSTLAFELLGIAQDQQTAGVGIALDVTRARSQLAAARAQLIAARNERDRARLELHRALGLPLTSPLVLADSLIGLPTDIEQVSEQDATDRAMRLRADLRAAEKQIAAAEQQLSAIRAERLPSVSAFADQGSTSKGPDHLLSTYTWGIAVSVPVFDGFRREGRLDEQRSALRELDVRQRDLVQQASIEVRGALLDIASAREQLTASDERLALAQQELAQARERFQAGVAGNADVITASISLNAARTQLVDARAGFQNARVALARAQGIVTALP
ncbi:MAG TPA: TolC family protein [Gemmatimonadaceae bacterium]|nr:TolC family protein [Gemmatimonadaceae bacterium]